MSKYLQYLKERLFGDYYFDSKTKSIKEGAYAKKKKCIFVQVQLIFLSCIIIKFIAQLIIWLQMVLENLWALYDAVVISKDIEKTQQIVKSLNIQLGARDQKHKDPKAVLQVYLIFIKLNI